MTTLPAFEYHTWKVWTIKSFVWAKKTGGEHSQISLSIKTNLNTTAQSGGIEVNVNNSKFGRMTAFILMLTFEGDPSHQND